MRYVRTISTCSALVGYEKQATRKAGPDIHTRLRPTYYKERNEKNSQPVSGRKKRLTPPKKHGDVKRKKKLSANRARETASWRETRREKGGVTAARRVSSCVLRHDRATERTDHQDTQEKEKRKRNRPTFALRTPIGGSTTTTTTNTNITNNITIDNKSPHNPANKQPAPPRPTNVNNCARKPPAVQET